MQACVERSSPPDDQHSGPVPGDSRRYENALVGLFACAAGLVFLNRAGIAYLFPRIRADFHLTNTQLGALIAVTAMTWGLSSISFSFLSDMIGGQPKLLIVTCISGFSVIGGLSGSMTSFSTLLVLRGVMGIFEGPVIPLIQSAVTSVSSPHRRGANLGVTMAGGVLIGGVLAPAMMIGLMTLCGWRSTFHVIAVPGIILAIAIALVMRADTARGDASNEKGERVRLQTLFSLMKRRNVMIGLVGAITLIATMGTLYNFLPLFLHDRVAGAAGWNVAILTAFAVGNTVGTALAPALSDRIGRKAGLIIALVSQLLVSLGILLSPLHVGFLALSFVAYFIAGGALTLMVYVIPGESVPPAMAASTYATLLFVGEMVGGAGFSALAGYLSDRFTLSASIWLCFTLSLVALIAALAVKEPSPTISS